MKKKVIAVLLAVVMVLGTVAVAAGGTTSITVVPGMSLRVNGKDVTPTNARGEEIEVFAYKDATYLPLRYLAELLGIKIDYDETTKTAIVEGAPIKEEIPTTGDKEYEADIVIVGAGAAGLMAAYTTTQGGAKVIILEKAADAHNSNFSTCGGPAAAETKIQAEEGATVTVDQLYEHLYEFSTTTVNAALLKRVLARTGKAIDSMVDMGVSMSLMEDTYGVGYRARHSISYAVDRIVPIVSTIEEQGGQFLYNTRGEHIIMEDGKAVGVTGTNTETGETVIVKAKAVMTCTGGFQGNEEMLHEIFGEVTVNSLSGFGANMTGDGINMVLEAGGQLDRNFGVLGNEFGGSNSKAVGGGMFGNANAKFWLYGGLYVDRSGERFINEKLVADFPLALGGEAVLRQGKVYAIMGKEYYEACATEGIWAYLGEPEDWTTSGFTKMVNSGAPEQLDAAIEQGWAWKADTLAELAEQVGLENLVETVAEYDAMCEAGEDTLFFKSPNFMKAIGEGPYVAIEYEPAAWSTFGGVKTDSHLRAVGPNGDPIPGLYCGGCEVGSYYAVPYYDSEGTCVGISLGSGVYAGEEMLKYIGVEGGDAPVAGGKYVPGTYTGEGQGFGGTVTAKVTVDANEIVDVVIAGPGETPAFGGAALAELAENAKAKGAEMDGVSGASLTSAGAKEAVADALAQAAVEGGTADEAGTVKDGTYTATAPGFSWVGMITADVTFKDGKLTAIDVTEESETVTGELFGMVKTTYIPRLIETQSLAADAVAGATVSSNAIRAIVADAIGQAGGKTSDWNRPVAKSTEVKKLEGYDVIVVGMGGSGMLSFCAASDQGAKVIGLEKGGKLGGNSTTTTGPMALNLDSLMENGEPYIDEDAIFDTWMEYVEGNKEAVVRTAVYTNKEALEYYMDKFGFEFTGLIMSFAKPEWNKLWTRYVNDPATAAANKLGPNKTYMYQRAVDKAIEMGTGSEYKLETTVTEMLTDDAGNVIGVKAVNVDGTTYEVYGKTVILATGGFIANEEMMLDTFGYTTQILGCTLCTGDGIKLGQSVGGALYALDVMPMIHIEQVPNLIRNDDLTGEQKAILSALALDKAHKAVNVNGEDYSRAATPAECYVPGFRYYNVYTQAEIDAIKAEGLSEAQTRNTSFFLSQGTLPAAGTPVADIETILAVGEKYKNVISGSIADLAKGIGCDEAALTAALGEDGKYYAVCCAGYAYATVGGLDIDENMNVLKEDGTPIANLFAVGQDSEGTCNIGQKAYSPWGGQAQSWTFTSGKIAGTQAAKVAEK